MGSDISSGFPLSSVSEIVANVDQMISEYSVWLYSRLLDISLTKKAFEIISELRCHYGIPEELVENSNTALSPKESEVDELQSQRSQSDDSAQSSCSDDDDTDSLNFRRLKHRANSRLVNLMNLKPNTS